MLISILAIVSLLLLLSSYVVYPAVVAILAQRKRAVPVVTPERALPRVALVVAAYNEELVIEEKLKNSLALDYPDELLSINVFSDASTDGTESIVKGYESVGVRLWRLEGRLGKTNAQNVLVSELSEDIVVFSDANIMYKPEAVRELVKVFSDPSVGAAIGHRRYVGKSKAGVSEGLYERYENWIKAKESEAGGTIGACGAIYAVRRAFYQPLDPARISDIVEPLRIASAGHSVVYVGDAIGEELSDNDFFSELSRKRRIVLRTLNSLYEERVKLWPTKGLLVKLLFHKIIRWFTLPLLITSSLGLWSSLTLVRFASLGVVCYLCVGIVLYSIARSKKERLSLPRVFNVILYSFGVFLSASMAIFDFTQGRNQVVWESRK